MNTHIGLGLSVQPSQAFPISIKITIFLVRVTHTWAIRDTEGDLIFSMQAHLHFDNIAKLFNT